MNKIRTHNKKVFTSLLIFSFALFLTILIWGVFFKVNNYKAIIKNYHKLEDLTFFERLTYNIKPFHKFNKKDFILNILAFSPFGIYLPLIFKKHTHLKGLLTCFGVSLLVETTQLITIIGTFSTNDLIANTLGYVVGYFFFNHLVVKFSNKLINQFNMAIIAIASPIAVMAIINTVSNLTVYVTKTM